MGEVNVVTRNTIRRSRRDRNRGENQREMRSKSETSVDNRVSAAKCMEWDMYTINYMRILNQCSVSICVSVQSVSALLEPAVWLEQ